MYKVKIGTMLLLVLLCFSSCSLPQRLAKGLKNIPKKNLFDMVTGKYKSMRSTSERDIAEQRMAIIMESIKNKDKEKLKSILSEKALLTTDLDENIEALFTHIEGDVLSCEYYNGGYSSGLRSYGKRTWYYSIAYCVLTTKGAYVFNMIQYLDDTDHPENVGLFHLDVYDMNQQGRGYTVTPEEMFSQAGIYVIQKEFLPDQIAEKSLEALLEAIKNQEPHAVSKLFGLLAINQIYGTDIVSQRIAVRDKITSNLFDFVKGNVQSFEKISGEVQETRKEDGNISAIADYLFRVHTDEDTYLFHLEECLYDTESNSARGLHRITVYAEHSSPPKQTADVGIFVPQDE